MKPDNLFYNYSVVNISEGDETGFKAMIPKFPKLYIVADSPEELHKMVQTAVREEIAFYKKNGIKIPAPDNFSHYSGKFLLRIDPALHQMLTELAAARGESLNQLVSGLLKDRLQSLTSA